MEDKKQPVVIKKVVKGGGHHGGAWKVAYADFVTAMMAFFLLLWLLGSTTPEQKAAISDYFQNPSPMQGPGGASTSMIDLGGAQDMPREIPRASQDEASDPELSPEEQEKQRLESLLEELNAAIEKSQALKPFKDQLLLDITPEGLRIQVVDKENRPMFDVGRAELKWYTQEILGEIARTINQVPNKISITGHTDARQFPRKDYTNWELSSDRANAARRELVDAGMEPGKIGRVVGLASSVLFDKENPLNPINRRISIIVMNKATEEAIQHEGRPVEPEAGTAPQPEAPAADGTHEAHAAH